MASLVDYRIGQRMVERWIEAVNDHCVESVVAQYAHNAVLIATIAPYPLIDKRDIRRYFVDFLSKPNLKGVINTIMSQPIKDGFVVSGTYTFSYGRVIKATVPARFSYVFIMTPKGYRILNHHSSKIPR